MANGPNFYPPVSFYFQLRFDGVHSTLDNGFQEANGLSVELEVEEIREGGTPYKHRLPTGTKYGNLVLRRGFVSRDSELALWCSKTLSTDFTQLIKPRNVQLSLLDENGTPLATWNFREAWPVKWSMSDFKSQENALAIETLEFACASFARA